MMMMMMIMMMMMMMMMIMMMRMLLKMMMMIIIMMLLTTTTIIIKTITICFSTGIAYCINWKDLTIMDFRTFYAIYCIEMIIQPPFLHRIKLYWLRFDQSQHTICVRWYLFRKKRYGIKDAYSPFGVSNHDQECNSVQRHHRTSYIWSCYNTITNHALYICIETTSTVISYTRPEQTKHEQHQETLEAAGYKGQ